MMVNHGHFRRVTPNVDHAYSIGWEEAVGSLSFTVMAHLDGSTPRSWLSAWVTRTSRNVVVRVDNGAGVADDEFPDGVGDVPQAIKVYVAELHGL